MPQAPAELEARDALSAWEADLPNWRCRNCKYWKQHRPEYDSGDCRAHPPLPFAAYALDGSGSNVFDTLWPQVGGKDWCGEFRLARTMPGAPPAPKDRRT